MVRKASLILADAGRSGPEGRENVSRAPEGPKRMFDRGS